MNENRKSKIKGQESKVKRGSVALRAVLMAGVTFGLPALASAAMLPDMIGAYQRTGTSSPAVTDQALWNEYGLKGSESGTYGSGDAQFTVTIYRLEDSTSALGAFDWQRSKDARESDLTSLAAETARSALVAEGNYLVSFEGHKPSRAELLPLLDGLRDVDSTPLPTLSGFFPSDGLVANSERYVIGPAGLAQFDPVIPPSVAAFHLGAEAQIGTFHGRKGDMTLALFNYPNAQIAIQVEPEFRKLAGAVVKRSGPLVAVVVAPPDADAAERLLAQVRYEAQVTLHEPTPPTINQFGSMIINIFILIGILLVFCLIAGLFVGGFRVFLLRGRKGQPESPMILLNLEQR
jgi:hypothetical protein